MRQGIIFFSYFRFLGLVMVLVKVWIGLAWHGTNYVHKVCWGMVWSGINHVTEVWHDFGHVRCGRGKVWLGTNHVNLVWHDKVRLGVVGLGLVWDLF